MRISLRLRHTIHRFGPVTIPPCPLNCPRHAPPPTPARGLDDLYDIARLAERLGVEHATIRVWLSRKVPWLPQPDGRLNGGAVWRATTLDGIEIASRARPPGPQAEVRPATRRRPTCRAPG